MFGSVLGLIQVLSEAIEVSDHLLFLAALDPVGFDKLHLFFGRLSEIQLLNGYRFDWVELFKCNLFKVALEPIIKLFIFQLGNLLVPQLIKLLLRQLLRLILLLLVLCAFIIVVTGFVHLKFLNNLLESVFINKKLYGSSKTNFLMVVISSFGISTCSSNIKFSSCIDTLNINILLLIFVLLFPVNNKLQLCYH